MLPYVAAFCRIVQVDNSGFKTIHAKGWLRRSHDLSSLERTFTASESFVPGIPREVS